MGAIDPRPGVAAVVLTGLVLALAGTPPVTAAGRPAAARIPEGPVPTPRPSAPNRLAMGLAAAAATARADGGALRRLERLAAVTGRRLDGLDRDLRRAGARSGRARRSERAVRRALATLVAADYTAGTTDLANVLGSPTFATALDRALRMDQATGAAATTATTLWSVLRRARRDDVRLHRLQRRLAVDRARLAAEAIVLTGAVRAARQTTRTLTARLAALRRAALRRAALRRAALRRAALRRAALRLAALRLAALHLAALHLAALRRAALRRAALRRARHTPRPTPYRTPTPSPSPMPAATVSPTPSPSSPASPTPPSSVGPGTLTVTTNLTLPSGLTETGLAAFLAGTPLSGDAPAFLAAERADHVSALFLAAAAILESGFGTSTLYRTRHNLYGWGADVGHPLRDAWSFPSDAACIAYVAWAIGVSYLTPPGSLVPGYRARPGARASVPTGAFYHGPSLLGISVDYAGNTSWAGSVAALADEIQSSGGPS